MVVQNQFLFGREQAPSFDSPLAEPLLFLNASLRPDVRYRRNIADIAANGDPFIAVSGNRVSSALVPAGKEVPSLLDADRAGSFLLELNLPLESDMFRTVDRPHELISAHMDMFEENIEALIAENGFTEREPGLFTGENVTVGKFVSIDTTNGPVVLDHGVTILDFTFLRGPVYVGRDSRVIEHAAVKDRTCVGSGCKVGGEVEESVIEPRSNKQHHGFLGHSFVGRWVNLGAGTSTSDLKNTYGEIVMDYGGGRAPTGMQFLGSIIGDHTKTAINTSLFTGKLLGVCSMVYGMVSTNVPSFSNYARSFGQVTEIGPDQVIRTQERVMDRRNIATTDRDREMIRRVFRLTRNERVIRMDKITF